MPAARAAGTGRSAADAYLAHHPMAVMPVALVHDTAMMTIMVMAVMVADDKRVGRCHRREQRGRERKSDGCNDELLHRINLQ